MIYFYMPYRVTLLPPAAEFLEGMETRLRAKVARTIALLQEFGPFLREPHSKKVSDWPGLFELRVDVGRDACRLFYFRHRLSSYVLTSGYMKKGMKLEPRELRRAASLMRQFLKEVGNE